MFPLYKKNPNLFIYIYEYPMIAHDSKRMRMVVLIFVIIPISSHSAVGQSTGRIVESKGIFCSIGKQNVVYLLNS